MRNPYGISASLICGNHGNILSDIEVLNQLHVERIHVDVMDGKFVPRYGLYPELVRAVRDHTNIPIQVHMMVENPEPYLKVFAEAGASIITVHPEPNQQIARTLGMIKDLGCQAGLGLNIHSHPETYKTLEGFVDSVILMAINPGINGQGCWTGIYQKIRLVRSAFHAVHDIEIDGGVTWDTAPRMVVSGATYLTCGTGTIYRPHEGNLVERVTAFRMHMNSKLEEWSDGR